MKKIITAVAFVVLSTMPAKAIDFSAFSLTGGLGASSGVFGASAKETSYTEAGAVDRTNKESGVFTDTFSSQFVELGIGSMISVGYEHTPDAISTPKNTNSHRNDVGESTARTIVSVDFNDMNTTYVKLNSPFGVYLKAGYVETSLDIKETTNGSNSYANKTTDGHSLGIGFQKFLGDSGLGVRFEGNYVTLASVSTDNGITAAGGLPANGGRNEVAADDLQGLHAKVAITYTLGRN